jgi:dipeptidyl aminopeptidase/acylaminoacyl peptidase
VRAKAPFGTWPSPVSPQALVEAAIGLANIEVAADGLAWTEARPNERGRHVLVASGADGSTHELVPEGFSARSLVHEYGGRCAAIGGDGLVVTSSMADQRLWRLAPGDDPAPLTPEPPKPLAYRYADPVLSPSGSLVVCVRERHGATVDNDLVVVDVETPRAPRELVAGHDFFAAPRLSPDGTRLAWLSWDHPAMPWDATELWVAPFHQGRLGEARRVAGGPGVSVSQPRFSPEGALHYLCDQSGYWNLYREDGEALALTPHDCGGPDWVFGQSTYAFLDEETLVVAWHDKGGQRLGIVSQGRLEAVETAFSAFSYLQGFNGRLACVAASPTEPAAIVLFDLFEGTYEVLRRSRHVPLAPEAISTPQPFDFLARDGEEAHGLYYPPASATHEGPDGERPPLVVVVHGGPTAQARHELNLALQQWTSRGFAVAEVDYRGSSGYGRAYRERLKGLWGLADVDDCADAARHLSREGLADPARIVIRGSSAGGMTVLNCLARHGDVFAVGASLYGVADLASLATDTHKFEAHYLDGLIGPWPEAATTYEERSPLHRVAQIRRPVIFFQGSDDPVVPRSQSDAIVAALEAAGVKVAYHVFEGEAHGFRQAETLIAVAGAELDFYRCILGLDPLDQR